MKYKIQSLFILIVMLMVSVPVYSAGEYEVVQIWTCELEDGTTEEQVEAIAAQYLKAVRTMEGGADATMRVFFPAVVNNTGETDLYFVLNTASFTDWGKIWDAYQEGSALAAADEANAGKINCADSMLWEAHVIEPAP
jgi:hypothetical protein